MNIKKTIKFRTKLFSISIALLIAGCSSDQTSSLGEDVVSGQFKDGAINIGIVGRQIQRRNGSLLAVRHINDNGGLLGRELNGVAAIHSSSSDAAAFAEDLMDKGVQALSVSNSSRSRKVIPIAAPRQIPMISESATSPALTNANDDDYWFRVVPHDIFQTEVLSAIAESRGLKRAVVIYVEGDTFGESLHEEFEKAFAKKGGVVVSKVPIPGDVDRDFSSYFASVYEVGADVIVHALNGGTSAAATANFFNESIEVGYDGYHLFTDTISGKDEFVQSLADRVDVEKMIGATGSIGLKGTASYEYFENEFIVQFGVNPQPYTTPAYDVILILAMAIERAGREYNVDSPMGYMIQESFREILNGPGEKVGPHNIARALEVIRSGEEIDYDGALSPDMRFDTSGDAAGSLVYTQFSVDQVHRTWLEGEQIIIEHNP